MFDTELNGQEVEIPEATGTVENEISNPEIAQAAPEPDTKKSDGVEQLRIQKRKLEKEREELARKVAEYEARNNPQPKQEPESTQLADDDLVEWKYVKREINQLKRELQGVQQQSHQSTAEQRLKTKYPDFDSVVTADNIETLKDLYPEIAQTIGANNDTYSKAATAYDIIKRYGIYKEDTFTAEKALAQKNAAKPKPLTSISPQAGSNPLDRANAFANGLTDDLKKQLWKEMNDSIKQGY